jgi:hypothetical protein
MTSTYEVESNRRNGQKSTGPKMAAGKERVRFNALRHGRSARTPVLPDDDSVAFAQRRDVVMDDLKPRGEVERALAETFVSTTWKRERCEPADTGLTA